MTIHKAIFKFNYDGGTGITNFTPKSLWKYEEAIKQYGNNYLWVEKKPIEKIRPTNLDCYSLHYIRDIPKLSNIFWDILSNVKEEDIMKNYKQKKDITLLAINEEVQPSCIEFRDFTEKAMSFNYNFNDKIPLERAIEWVKPDFLVDTGFIEEIKSKITYSVGDHFKSARSGKIFILAITGKDNKVQLIRDDYKSYYREGAKVHNIKKITLDEFSKICKNNEEYFTLIKE